MRLSLRIWAAILAPAFLVLVVVAAGAEAGSPGPPPIQGDANCDGTVNADDALTILLQIAGPSNAAATCPQTNEDTDCNGGVDSMDIVAILQYSAGDSGVSSLAAGCPGIGSPAVTASPPPTDSGSVIPTEPGSGTPSPTSTVASASQTPVPSPSETTTPTGTVTPTPTVTITPTPTATPTPTVSASPTLSPTPTATVRPTCGVLPDAEGGVSAEAVGTPQANNYKMTLLPANADVNKLTNVVPVPSAPGLAVITQESGQIYTVCLRNDDQKHQLADLSNIVRDFHGTNDSDEGLTGFAFDPTDSSYVYVIYSMPPDPPSPSPGAPYWGGGTGTPPANAVRSRISGFHIVDGQIDTSSEKVILDIYQPWEWHNADGLVFGPDGDLYIGSGDGGIGYAKGQTLNDLLGAILRIHVTPGTADYTVPHDNPFYNVAGAAPEVWAYGLRNPWRFSFDSAAPHTMWIADVGESSYEEVNIGQAGANYGWAVMEGYNCFVPNGPTPTPGPTCSTAGYATPRAVYTHDLGCAIQGGYVYHGSTMPELDGYFIYGDFCSGRIWGVNTQNSQSAPILLVDSSIHPTSWAITAEGDIVAVNYVRLPTFTGTPGIYKLERVN